MYRADPERLKAARERLKNRPVRPVDEEYLLEEVELVNAFADVRERVNRWLEMEESEARLIRPGDPGFLAEREKFWTD